MWTSTRSRRTRRSVPGSSPQDLKNTVAEAGLYYPPDPASADTCTVGGNIATNAGGLCCIKYGVTSTYVKALEVVLPGGEVMRTGHRTAKGVAGYDLTGLFVGSEGTLGVVTSAVVHLIPMPDPPLTALATFDSLDKAVDGILAVRADPHRPNLLEFLDRTAIEAIQAVGDFGFPDDCEAALLVQSDRPGHTREDVARYADLLSAAGAEDIAVADDRWEAEALMAGRRMLGPALEMRGARLAEDACVPVAHLAEFVRESQAHLASDRRGDRHGRSRRRRQPAPGAVLRPRRPREPAPGGVGTRRGPRRGTGSRAAPSPGSTAWVCSNAATSSHELGEAELTRQRAVKAVFDPLGLMNPGKVY